MPITALPYFIPYILYLIFYPSSPSYLSLSLILYPLFLFLHAPAKRMIKMDYSLYLADAVLRQCQPGVEQ